jgi:hypothetical protein
VPADLTRESLDAAWPEIISAARERSILLGQALAATTIAEAGRGEVRLAALPGEAVLVEGVERQLALVEELIAARFGGPVRVRVAGGGGSDAPAARPKRLTDEGLRSERLDRLRRLDPALDTAANELDLEIVDEGPRSS